MCLTLGPEGGLRQAATEGAPEPLMFSWCSRPCNAPISSGGARSTTEYGKPRGSVF